MMGTLNRLGLCAVLTAAGIALLATAALAGAKGPRTHVKEGGTLRLNVSATDIQSIDPAVDYENTGWAVEFATCLKLINYPDKPGAAGTVLIPERARDQPRSRAEAPVPFDCLSP
jgi:hypothetical protein